MRGSTTLGCAAAIVLASAGAWSAPRPAGERLLVIGDSNAVGVGVLPAAVWTNRLERSEKLFVQVWGGPGMSVAHPVLGLARLSECAQAVQGFGTLQAAFLALGSNDYSGTVALDDVRAGVRRLLQSVSTTWICITPLGRMNETVPNALGLTLQDYRTAIASECQALGAALVQGELVVPSNSRLLGGDGLHLTGAGHDRLFRVTRDVLRSLLDVR